MTKVFYLPTKLNTELLKLLYLESQETEHWVYLNEVAFNCKLSLGKLVPLNEEIVVISNKILLDNLFGYITDNQSNQLLNVMSNGTLVDDLYLSHKYLPHALEVIQPETVDDRVIGSLVYSLLKTVYTKHCSSITSMLFEMYQYLLSQFTGMAISTYRFELVDNGRPMLLIGQNYGVTTPVGSTYSSYPQLSNY